MQCPACGNEKYRVLRQPTRGFTTERRLVECTDCEMKFSLINGLESVRIRNPHTMKCFDLPIDKFDDTWMEYVLGRRAYPGTGAEC